MSICRRAKTLLCTPKRKYYEKKHGNHVKETDSAPDVTTNSDESRKRKTSKSPSIFGSLILDEGGFVKAEDERNNLVGKLIRRRKSSVKKRDTRDKENIDDPVRNVWAHKGTTVYLEDTTSNNSHDKIVNKKKVSTRGRYLHIKAENLTGDNKSYNFKRRWDGKNNKWTIEQPHVYTTTTTTNPTNTSKSSQYGTDHYYHDNKLINKKGRGNQTMLRKEPSGDGDSLLREKWDTSQSRTSKYWVQSKMQYIIILPTEVRRKKSSLHYKRISHQEPPTPPSSPAKLTPPPHPSPAKLTPPPRPSPAKLTPPPPPSPAKLTPPPPTPRPSPTPEEKKQSLQKKSVEEQDFDSFEDIDLGSSSDSSFIPRSEAKPPKPKGRWCCGKRQTSD